jgi:hypothetical protein
MFPKRRALLRALFAFLFAALASGPAAATFHLWALVELYSNADGSVQFLEMVAQAPQQEFIAGHTLSASQGSQVHTFNVTTSLPGDSAGHRMIFATQGFANLGIVTPDVIVPNGFFFTGSGTVNWAGADVWNYSALPSDGRLSLNRDGTTAVNSPLNFAGQTGTVTPAASSGATRNYQGLWYRGEVESGWGVNVAHQGDVLFATWFTYASDGSGLWLVAPDVEKTAPDTYSGALFQTTGPSFDAVPFDPKKVVPSPVGNVTFAFSDLNNGTFTYTLNGITQSKPIIRQLFGTHIPTCVSGGTPGTPLNFQDLWYRSPAESESGWGVNITHQDDILFATWFTYGADGKGVWFVMPRGEKTGTNTYSGALFRTTGPAFSASPWDPTKVVPAPAGTATFSFSDFGNGTFTYTVGTVTQSKPITRQVFRTPTVCQ